VAWIRQKNLALKDYRTGVRASGASMDEWFVGANRGVRRVDWFLPSPAARFWLGSSTNGSGRQSESNLASFVPRHAAALSDETWRSSRRAAEALSLLV